METLRDDQLVLKPISIEHIGGPWLHMSNPKITPFLAWSAHTEKSQTEQVVQNLIKSQEDGKGVHWVIQYNNIICGLISIIDIHRKHITWTLNRGELAFWISPEFWGKQLALKSSNLVLNYVFNDFNLHKLVVAHASENNSSERVIQKLKFKYVGEFTDAFCKNGRWHNLKYYELIGRDWLAHIHSTI